MYCSWAQDIQLTSYIWQISAKQLNLLFGIRHKLSAIIILTYGVKTSAGPGYVGPSMETGLVNMDGKLTTSRLPLREALTTFPTYALFSGRIMLLDRMIACVVKSLL